MSQAQMNHRAFVVLAGTAVFMAVLWILTLTIASEFVFTLSRDVTFGGLILAGLIGAALSRYGRPHAGAWLFIIANYTINLWFVWFQLAGLGPLMALLALLISGSIASTTLPQRYVNTTLVATIFGSILIMLGDLLSPISRTVASSTTFLTVVTVLTLLVYGIFVFLQFRHYTLRTKLSILFVVIGILSATTVGAVVTEVVETSVTSQVANNLTLQTEKLSDFLGAIFVHKASQVQSLATSSNIMDALAESNEGYEGSEAQIIAEIERLDRLWVAAGANDPFIEAIISSDRDVNPVAFQLQTFLSSFPDHMELFVTDRYGATVAATNRLSDYYQADETWWQAAWNDGRGAVYLSDVEFDESINSTAILIALPVFAANGTEVVGIIRSTLELDVLFDVVADVQIGETGYGLLVDRQGDVLFESLVAEDGLGTQAVAAEVRLGFLAPEPGSFVRENENGDESIFAYAPVHVEGFAEYELAGGSQAEGMATVFETAVSEAVAKLGWAVVLRQEAHEAYAAISRVSTAVTLTSLAFVSVLVVAAVIFANSLTRPIRALGQAAAAIAEGNLDVPLPPTSEDEIGQLTAEFANMANQLQQIVSELQQRTLVIETSSEVSRHLSTILNEQELLKAVVSQVQRGFNYYHAHIYLLEDGNERLTMAAGTGQAAQEMLAQRHRIRVGSGLVGRAAETKETVLVSDVRQDSTWLPNALLPETKAEIAIPILLSGQVLGVLDVQHNVVNGLQQEDADLLQLLANQIAIALQNARLFTQTQQQANQQALINEIARKIQASPTIERVLQTAAEELGQALNTHRTTIQLNSRQQRNGR